MKGHLAADHVIVFCLNKASSRKFFRLMGFQNYRLLPATVLHVMGSVCFGITYLMPRPASSTTTAQWMSLSTPSAFWWVSDCRPTRRFKRELHPRDGFLLVRVWVLMAMTVVPMIIPNLSFTDAFFRNDVRIDHYRSHGIDRASVPAAGDQYSAA